MVVLFMLPGAEEMCSLFMMVVIYMLPRAEETYIYYLLRMVVIFMLPRAEETYSLFAKDRCHFYAAKS